MALLFTDPCAANSLNLWDSPASITYTTTGGPFGSDRYMSGGFAQLKVFPAAKTSIIVGALLQHDAGGSSVTWGFFDGATAQFTLVFENVGGGNHRYVLRRGTSSGTVVATSTNTFLGGIWRWVELKVTSIGNAATAVLKVDTVTEFNEVGIDVTSTANNSIDRVQGSLFGSFVVRASAIWMGDVTGTTHNDFKGPRRGGLSLPTADGTFTAWPANTGTRFGAVDDIANDGDTTYVSSSTPADKVSFQITDTPTGVVPDCVLLTAILRRDDAGPRTARVFLRKADGTIVNAATESISASYIGYNYLYDQDPFGVVAWSKSVYDGMEAGVELVS